jgi:hypothetical protein
MIIWIVEDDKSEVNKVVEAALAVAKSRQNTAVEKPLALYWDATIEWKPSLQPVDDPLGTAQASAGLPHPEIVILDLFDRDGEFKAQSFLRALRHWEASQSPPLPASRVILWSVHSGLTAVDSFLREEPDRDQHVISLQTKGQTPLGKAIAGCWDRWEEERYP